MHRVSAWPHPSSVYGISLYSLALHLPLALASSGVWHTTEEKINVLKDLGISRFSFYQTLVKNPLYANEEPEEVTEGYKSGGYVAIIAEK